MIVKLLGASITVLDAFDSFLMQLIDLVAGLRSKALSAWNDARLTE